MRLGRFPKGNLEHLSTLVGTALRGRPARATKPRSAWLHLASLANSSGKLVQERRAAHGGEVSAASVPSVPVLALLMRPVTFTVLHPLAVVSIDRSMPYYTTFSVINHMPPREP